MRHWLKLLTAAALALPVSSCLWGPGKFTSDLMLKRDGSFVLDYKGELVIQLPPDADDKMEPWTDDKAKCWVGDDPSKERPCTTEEIAEKKLAYEKRKAEEIQMAKARDFRVWTTNPTGPSRRSSANMPDGDRSPITRTASSTSITTSKAAQSRTSFFQLSPTMTS